MNIDIQPHRRANESRLEEFREEIVEMRRKRWPLRRIAGWLAQHRSIRISHEAIRKFCLVRGIIKGRPKHPITVQREEPRIEACVQDGVTPKFHYDDSAPIQTRRSK